MGGALMSGGLVVAGLRGASKRKVAGDVQVCLSVQPALALLLIATELTLEIDHLAQGQRDAKYGNQAGKNRSEVARELGKVVQTIEWVRRSKQGSQSSGREVLHCVR